MLIKKGDQFILNPYIKFCMANKIQANKLDWFLWRPGPYIYFYNGNCGGLNSKIVENMNKMANKFQNLFVYEIDWKDIMEYRPYTKIKEKNSIFLYFNGKMIEDISKPDMVTINSLFEKAIEFYNSNIERRIKNVGMKSLRLELAKKVPLTKTENYKLNRCKMEMEWRRKNLQKQKIIKDPEPEKTLNIQFKSHSAKNLVVMVRKKPSKSTIKISKKVNKYDIGGVEVYRKRPWFCDAEMKDLPLEIFSDDSQLGASLPKTAKITSL